jgi:CRISPR/Cas system-associated exonuclease Cas4 (RecB family)
MFIEDAKKALKKKYSLEIRTGVHVSDLLLCPRKAVFNRLKEQDIGDLELSFFTIGRMTHEAVQSLVEDNPDYEQEKLIEYEGIEGHVDVYHKPSNTPIEFKTARSKVTEPKVHQVEQLHKYMAILNANKGIIAYQKLMDFNSPYIEFEIFLTKAERQKHLTKLKMDKDSFVEALENGQPMWANSCWNNKDKNWLCRNCPYKLKCKEWEKI